MSAQHNPELTMLIVEELVAALKGNIFRLARAPEAEAFRCFGNQGGWHDLRGMRLIENVSVGLWRLTPLGRAVQQQVLSNPKYLADARVKVERDRKVYEAHMAKIFGRKFPDLDEGATA